MKKRDLLITTAVLASLLSACSYTPIPVAASYPKTEQQIMQAAHHWEVLAEHVAGNIQQRLDAEGQQMQNQWAGSASLAAPTSLPMPTSANTLVLNPDGTTGSLDAASMPAEVPMMVQASPLPAGMPTLYINPPGERASSFAKGFYSLLQTHLTSRGVSVVTRQDGPYTACYSPGSACKPLTLKYDVQVVQHKDRDIPVRYPGRYTAAAATLGGSAYFIEQVEGWDKGWAVLPLALAADARYAKKLMFPDETNAEVLITTAVLDGELVIFSDTSIYYINAGDDDQYDKGTTTFRLRNGG